MTVKTAHKLQNPPETLEDLRLYLNLSREGLRFNDDDIKLIWLAYTFAREAHENQKRDSGESYIFHPLAVAQILIDMGLDAETIAAALLHDVVEDTRFTKSQIEEQFGSTVAILVDGVTKLSKYNYNFPDRAKSDAESIRKLFLAMISDVRVILIKLADRLHNLRTIDPLPENRKNRIAKETLEIYSPIAERLGIWRIKAELEDLSFKVLHPKMYFDILRGIEKSREDHDTILNKIIQTISDKMVRAGMAEGSYDVSGRSKHIYSIYRKMHTPKYEGQGVDRVYDKLGVRIIVNTIPECYTVLGLIHSEWSPIPGEFDDYIGMRLPSGYQSLHSSVKYGPGKNDIVEFQIRTFQMHHDAEYGIAAHWVYKEKSHAKRDLAHERKIAWLRQMLDEPQPDDPESFVAILKADVLQDRVYTFTPKGDIIDLPVGSTPIDFAYSVHTDIGHRCRGAKVNGKLVTLDNRLKTGDTVEILTTKQGGPSRDWLNSSLGLVHTQRARSKIKQWFKRQDWELNLTQGKQLLDRELRKLGLSDDIFDVLIRDLEFKTMDDLYVGLGCGDISVGRIINKISEAEKGKLDVLPLPTPSQPDKKVGPDSVTVLGLKGILTSIAKCCKPAPGDEIIGYITRGRGATIHRRDCPNILRLDDHDRIVKVSWGEPQRTYPVSVEIRAYDRQGLMGDISNVLNNEGINLVDIGLKVSHNLAAIKLVLEVGDISQLSRVLTRIENLPNVMEAHRLKPG